MDLLELDCARQWRVYSRQQSAAEEQRHRSPEQGLAHLDSLIRSGGTGAQVSGDADFGDAYLYQETFIADDG